MHSFLISLLLFGVGIAAPQTFNESQALVSARDLFKQGQFQKSAAAYRAIIDQDKSSAPAYAGLVQSYLKSDDVTAAEEASARALADLPQSALVHAIRGDVYFREGLLYKAESEYRQAMKLDGKCARAWLGQEKIEAIVGRNAQAGKSFERAHDLDNEDEEILFRWAVVQVYPHNVEALEKYLSEFRSDPEDERRKREFLELIKGIADRKIWVLDKEVTHAEVKLEPINPLPRISAGFGIPITLNGTVKARVLLDTGSTWLAVSKKLADKAGARKISDQLIEGVGGAKPINSYMAWIDKVSVGGIEFHDCLVRVLLHDAGYIDGVLGTEVLKDNLVTLDFPRQRLLVDPSPKRPDTPADNSEPVVHSLPAPSGTAQMFTFGHVPLIAVHVVTKTGGLMVLDTGASTVFISPELAHQAGLVPRSDWNRSPDFFPTIEEVTLQFSGKPSPAHNVMIQNFHLLSKRMGTEISGMIGISTLRSMTVTINYRDGVVEFKESK